jgi:hypothetical protein
MRRDKKKGAGMSKKKLIGVIGACIAVVIVVVVILTRPAPIYTLSVNISPPGAGSVSSSGGDYESGEQVTLTVYPASNYTFDRWGGDASGNASTITITMDSDRGLIVNFKAIYTLTTYVYPPEAGSASPAYAEYESGALVTLNATPASGYIFQRWSGFGTWPTIIITMDSCKNVTAYFVDENSISRSISGGRRSGKGCGRCGHPSFAGNA